MRSILRKILSRMGEPATALFEVSEVSALSTEFNLSDIERYYERVIVNCLERMQVSMDSIEVDVKRIGAPPAGLPSFAGYVRILKWDPAATPLLLQNLSAIDARIRKVVKASFILEHTEFAGVWFQATSGTHGAPQALLGAPCQRSCRPLAAASAA